MNNILVPTDFSEASKEALRFAVQIASVNNAMITLVHVIYTSPLYKSVYFDEMTVTPSGPSITQQLKLDACKELDKLKNGFVPLPIHIEIETSTGDIAPAILMVAQETRADIIIMGRASSSGIEDFFLGSITEKVIRKSNIPVFAIEKTTALSKIRKILCPSNLREERVEYFQQLKSLQSFFNAELHLLLVNTPQHFQTDEQAQKKFEEYIQGHSLKNCTSHFINHFTEEKGIIEFQSKHKMDMIAMSTHGNKGIKHWFHLGITEEVIKHLNCPIWTFNALKN
ncbi:universal stress protein [Echinicola shivajiensis]|uniref:universal stress protein n=1 Tax=Echinicola shivajiensis TaxID=1035916 RepID=UPI001BFC9693|nr:universal stress protein [Echinicola shivajiensis]